MDYVPLTPYAPGVGARSPLSTPPLPPLFMRRPHTTYGSSNAHDASDLASACGIDGPHKFPVFPLATPTRMSVASFEPLLPLLTRRRLLLFIIFPCSARCYSPPPFCLEPFYSLSNSLLVLGILKQSHVTHGFLS